MTRIESDLLNSSGKERAEWVSVMKEKGDRLSMCSLPCDMRVTTFSRFQITSIDFAARLQRDENSSTPLSLNTNNRMF